MIDLAVLPPHVRDYLRGYVLRRRRLAVVRAAGIAGCLFLGVLLAACLADRFIHFRASVRWALLLAAGFLAVGALLRALLRLSRPEVDWLAVADRIETQNSTFGQRLLTVASQLLDDSCYRGSDEMLGQLAHQLNQDAAGQRPSLLLPARAVAGPWMLLVLFSVAAVGLGQVTELNLPQLALRFLAPWLPLPAVTTTTLNVWPGDQDVRQGATVRIEARIDRLGGAPVWLYLAEAGQSGFRQVPMAIADDAAASATSPTSPSKPLRLTYTIGSVDRDLKYYVVAGDAVSPKAHLRVLRKPGVAEFRLRYLFPAYMGRLPLDLTRSDGRIEAPIGTEVQVTLVATEPLQAAMLAYAGEKQLLSRPTGSSDERIRFGKLVVSREGKIDIDLISARDQAGTGPPTAEVKPLVDRPPIARLLGSGQVLRAGAGEVLPIAYDAIDDYGVDSVNLRMQSGLASVDVPIYPRPANADPSVEGSVEDPHRREGAAEVDLATLPLSPGDLVTLTLQVKDSAGSSVASDPLQVLISPRAPGVESYERTVALEEAAQLAASAAEDLESAARTLVESAAVSDGEPAKSRSPIASTRSVRRVNASASASVMIRRSLLRAINRGPSSALASVLTAWIDAVQNQASVAEAIFREAAGEPRSDSKSTSDTGSRSRASRPMLRDADLELSESAGRLRDELRTASRAERATLLLSDIDTLRVTEKRGPIPPADKTAQDRLRLATQRLRDEIGAGLKSVGLMDRPTFSSEQSRDVSRKLKDLVERGQRLYKAKSKLDLLPAVRDWALRVQRNGWQPITLDERLLADAHAEAIRPGGNARRARDYHLAGRAAVMIEMKADRSRPTPVSPELAEQFTDSFIAICKEAELDRATAPLEEGQTREIRQAALLARKQMSDWADGESSATSRPVLATIPTTASAASLSSVRLAKVESIAMQASAEASGRDFIGASVTDAKLLALASQTADLANRSVARQAMAQARRATEAARTIDQFVSEQALVARVMSDGQGNQPSDAVKLAATQNAMADRIGSAGGRLSPIGAVLTAVSDVNARERAAAAIMGAENRLKLVSRQLVDLLEADADHRLAVQKLNDSKRQIRDVSPKDKEAARRMVEVAAREENESATRLAERSAFLQSNAVQALLALSEPFVIDISALRDLLNNRLGPVLRSLTESVHAEGGRESAEHAVADAQRIIDSAHSVLSDLQSELAERDPLVVAKWLTRASAEALARTPPDLVAAAKYPAESRILLVKTCENFLRYAAAQRMVAARSVRPMTLQRTTGTQPTTEPLLTSPGTMRFPSLGTLTGEWRRYRQRDTDDGNGLLREVEPAGYETALKAYFEAIGRK